MVLRLKSILYRYTGVFLAHKEELEYIDSKKYWKAFMKIAVHKENDLSPRDIHGTLLGSWQAHNGFSRPMVRPFFLVQLKYPKFKLLFNLINNVCTGYVAIKWDIQDLYYKIKKKYL